MRAVVHPGGFVGGTAHVPGDKSIAHRWLLLAATADGRSKLRGVPAALDVRATGRCLAELAPRQARGALDGWASRPAPEEERDRSTTNDPRPRGLDLVLEAHGRAALEAPGVPLDCANSGTTMRLLAGVLAGLPFASELVGDESLSRRPMERVAEPLRAMGAEVRTTDGHAPVVVRGAALRGIEHRVPVPSAQVKSAVLLAGLAASGATTVLEPAPTRDHTERALAHLGAPIEFQPGRTTVRAFQHGALSASVPGDLSSAAFLVAAAVLTGSALEINEVGLNPTRARFIEVLGRMGADVRASAHREELGEPVGSLSVGSGHELVGTTVEPDELPLVIDEVPMLALAATHARGVTRFAGAGELKVKESDRLGALADVIRALGGDVAVEGDELVVGGGGLRGGEAPASTDHRIVMAVAAAALAAREPTTIAGIEAADVSFPGFVDALRSLGARVER
ncbi:MAG TPA: 3-phosphoshikimate 1-carboxyvinyltransferase [Actinomycetota bacterium]|nr:3-phosphoshikimate 1-carboxyvinyltransferase [Actinomycetota bacterium]